MKARSENYCIYRVGTPRLKVHTIFGVGASELIDFDIIKALPQHGGFIKKIVDVEEVEIDEARSAPHAKEFMFFAINYKLRLTAICLRHLVAVPREGSEAAQRLRGLQ